MLPINLVLHMVFADLTFASTRRVEQSRQRVRAKRGPMTSSAPWLPKRFGKLYFGKLRCPAIGGSRSKAERFITRLRSPIAAAVFQALYS
jgi:hypothetical protein